MRTTFFGFCLLLVGLSFPSSATPNDLFQNVIRTYEGKMTAQDQEMTAITAIFREGDSIAATLGLPGDAKLTMTLANYDLENRGLLFQWKGAESSTGYVVFWFSSNYESFEGTWGWDDSYTDGGNWTGRSVPSGEKKEEEAKQLAEEEKKEEEAKQLAEEEKKEEEAKQLAEERKKNDLAALLATKKCVSCDLAGVDLSNADLTAAKLVATDLRKSNLSGADLSGADLSGADLRGANLSGINLAGADVHRAKGIPTTIRLVLANERVKLNPGFRDLKPGLTSDELELMNICEYRLSGSFTTCYDLDNIKFGGEFASSILRVLRIDLGPYVGGNFIQSITEMVEGDPILNMRGTLGSKYELDYEYSERDRQLFNEGEKELLYTVFANGQVALVLIRIEKDYSVDIRSYVEYRDKETGKRFLEDNKPKKATSSDF